MDTHLKTASTLSTTEEENSSKMFGGGNRSYVSRQTRPHIESLPDDIIFAILVRLPAQDIYDATRLVCRKWYKMIHARNFIHAHFQQSTCGLLIQDKSYKRNQPTFVATRKGRIEISKLSYEFTCTIWSSCNGLILEPHENRRDLYITNPATKQHFDLPPFSPETLTYGSALAYAATSMEYKVVCTFYSYACNSISQGCAILTVGVDKDWTRHVNTEHLSLAAKELLLLQIPFNTEGFVHWALSGNFGMEYVVTLNVETEIITQFRVPLRHREGLRYYYFSKGSYLSLLIAYSYLSWEVWEMKPETGEWTKVTSIDLEAQKRTFQRLAYKHYRFSEPLGSLNCRLAPVGWSNFQEVLVFGVYVDISTPFRFCIAYNVRTQEIDSFELDSSTSCFLVHRNSLVWLEGC